MQEAVRERGLDLLFSRFAVYQAFVRIAFLKMLAYRLRYFTGIVTYLLFVSVNYFIWQAIFFEHPPGALVNGFTLSEMITYITIGWIARSLYFSNIDVEINELVRSGEVSAYLIRPVHFHLLMLAQSAGESVFRLLFFTTPISVVLLILFPVSLPASLTHGILFLVATAISFFTLAEINFLIGLSAFALKSIDGVMRAKYFLIQLFSGLLLPLTFFPSSLRALLDYLPLKNIAYVPLQLYLGKISATQYLEIFFSQLLWILAMAVLAQILWKRVIDKLTVQGG